MATFNTIVKGKRFNTAAFPDVSSIRAFAG
jgi:hypothetical protein